MKTVTVRKSYQGIYELELEVYIAFFGDFHVVIVSSQSHCNRLLHIKICMTIKLFNNLTIFPQHDDKKIQIPRDN
jgi:hypothetical protein